jgi:hypothetical protein
MLQLVNHTKVVQFLPRFFLVLLQNAAKWNESRAIYKGVTPAQSEIARKNKVFCHIT